MSQSQIIFIYGVPGTGKTYYSKLLGKQLGLPVIEGDKIKNIARKGRPKNQFPFLYLGTCQAYQVFGELNQVNAIQGLKEVREALRPFVIEEIKKQNSFILEAAFLDPNELQQFGKVILLTLTDENLHKKRYLSHREKILDFSANEFKTARIIQKFLIEEAEKLGIQTDLTF